MSPPGAWVWWPGMWLPLEAGNTYLSTQMIKEMNFPLETPETHNLSNNTLASVQLRLVSDF